MSDLDFDVLVVGAGPAGLGAACAAAQSRKLKVGLVDNTPWLGGQIWRGQNPAHPQSPAKEWFDRVRNASIEVLDQTSIIGTADSHVLLAERQQGPCRIGWKKLVIATGARELLVPFPGWTLPGVLGPGGLLNLSKNGWPVSGKRVVVAGSGPLLLAAAEGLVKRGAEVVAVYEQADWGRVASFGFGLWRRPAKFWQALRIRSRLIQSRYQCGVWPVRAEGAEQVQRVVLTDGRKTWSEDCDLLACAFGLVPNLELPTLLGCELRAGFVEVDRFQATSSREIYAAGELTGISGADSALVQGQIAGYAAAGEPGKAEALFASRASWTRFGISLARAFALRPQIAAMADPDTIVCRCEDVPLKALQPFEGWRAAKLQSRCGMGPCQGRVCGPACELLLGWQAESVRPPILPARVASLITDG